MAPQPPLQLAAATGCPVLEDRDWPHRKKSDAEPAGQLSPRSSARPPVLTSTEIVIVMQPTLQIVEDAAKIAKGATA